MASIINASTSSGIVQTADTSGVLQLQTASTTAVTVDASQNVGIGTTTPQGKFNVFGTSIVLSNPNGTTNDSNGVTITTFSSSTPWWSYITNNASHHEWQIYGTEKMRIDTSGNLLVGCTGGPTGGTPGILIGSPANSGSLVGSNSTSSTFMFRFYNPNGYCGGISTSASATTYATSSDYRLKENIVPMTGALDKVAQLKPVTYTWKIDNSAGQGFIAHELQSVIPDCVIGEKDAVDAEGKPIYQGVDTSFLVATLTAAIQEQQTIINDLKARITALEGAK
jgi:hypothetical protein